MTKELFEITLRAMQEQDEKDIEYGKKLAIIYNSAFEANLLYDNSKLFKALIRILSIELFDENKFIEYFIEECNYGKNPKKVIWKDTNDNKKEVLLDSAEKLYDFLLEYKEQ